MTTETAARDQANAAGALLALVTQFPDLPAADFDITTGRVETDLRINVHRNPSGFEQWRQALDLDPDTADGSHFPTFQTIEIPGTYAGIRVLLVGYLPLPAEPATAA
ncbi:hypothetical protein EDD99_3726 [Streptomyces sp. 846.5]|nr:hypothetical protein [Streptomyces sp. 846.5]TDU05221.1 hypothetical protein EDD99_3726 [Streptomyces sp. 846.5]